MLLQLLLFPGLMLHGCFCLVLREPGCEPGCSCNIAARCLVQGLAAWLQLHSCRCCVLGDCCTAADKELLCCMQVLCCSGSTAVSSPELSGHFSCHASHLAVLHC